MEQDPFRYCTMYRFAQVVQVVDYSRRAKVIDYSKWLKVVDWRTRRSFHILYRFTNSTVHVYFLSGLTQKKLFIK